MDFQVATSFQEMGRESWACAWLSVAQANAKKRRKCFFIELSANRREYYEIFTIPQNRKQQHLQKSVIQKVRDPTYLLRKSKDCRGRTKGKSISEATLKKTLKIIASCLFRR